MNAQEISILVKIAFADWPKVEVTPELTTNWALVLGSHDFESARQALQTVLREPGREWTPRANEILAEIERATKKPTLPRYDGPLLETYTREFTIAGKKETKHYVRSSKGYRDEYAQHAKEQGHKYTEVRASVGVYDDNGRCLLPDSAMKQLFAELHKLMDASSEAHTPEEKQKVEQQAHRLKEIYFELLGETKHGKKTTKPRLLHDGDVVQLAKEANRERSEELPF